MAQINWNPFAPELDEGVYLAEVAKAEEKPSKSSGDLMFAISLKAVDFGMKPLCDDNIMLEGKGAGMGTARLIALGFSGKEPEIQAHELIGRRAHVNVALETYKNPTSGRSFTSLKVVKHPDASVGYWPETVTPDGVKKPQTAVDEETPF